MRRARRAAGRALIALGLWWVLTDGSLGAPVLAALVVASTTAAAMAFVPPLGRVRPLGLARFAGFFVRESVLGGIDVARRAFARGRPDVDPAFVERELRLAPGAPRLLFVGCISLLPGTLSAHLGDDRVLVHVLDPTMSWEETLDALEQRVGDVFGDPSPPA